ncbi:MAG: nucleoside phosphorylase [Solobacterium sp.]|nr:nucleoside phosphorylase [Solobacterium sp.]
MIQPHIQLEETTAKAAVLPGDPARLDRIAKELSDVRELAYNREFRSLIGTYHNVPLIACSTGIGGSSASIAIEELHNIGITSMIRIGSCGALQKGIGLGDLVFASGAVRDDGTSKAYADIRYPAVPDLDLLNGCVNFARANGWANHVGIVHSHESFYIDTNAEEERYWSRFGVLGADMETAALFTVGRIRGIRTASILNNVVVYGSDTSESIGSYADGAALTAEGERREILCALEALTGVTQ